MAFKAVVHIDGKIFTMKDFHFSGSQGTDATNKPASRPVPGYMNFVVETTKDNFLWLWFTKPYLAHSGKVMFLADSASGPMKTIKFQQGYCVEYEINFSDSSSLNTTTAFSVSAGVIDIDGVDDKKLWG